MQGGDCLDEARRRVSPHCSRLTSRASSHSVSSGHSREILTRPSLPPGIYPSILLASSPAALGCIHTRTRSARDRTVAFTPACERIETITSSPTTPLSRAHACAPTLCPIATRGRSGNWATARLVNSRTPGPSSDARASIPARSDDGGGLPSLTERSGPGGDAHVDRQLQRVDKGQSRMYHEPANAQGARRKEKGNLRTIHLHCPRPSRPAPPPSPDSGERHRVRMRRVAGSGMPSNQASNTDPNEGSSGATA